MRELLPLYGVCFILAYVVNRRSVYDYGSERYIYRDRTWFIVLSTAAVLFAGLRTSYNDTHTYIVIYDKISVENGLLYDFTWGLSDHPGFYFICRILKKLHFSSQSFLMFFSIFSIGTQLWFIRKYANNIGLAVYVFLTIGCFCFSMAAIKQCTATAICLIAIDRLIRKRYILFIVLVLLAVTCHPFSIVFIICPLLFTKPWTKYTYILIFVGIIAAFSLQSWLGNALDLVSIMGIEYNEENFVSEGVNIFRVLVVWAPVLLSFFLRRYGLLDEDDPVQNLMINLMILCALIMFIALFGNPIYIGRLANYFLIFQCIGLSYLLQYFHKDSRSIMIIILIILYFAYSYYGNAINSSFDSNYNSISIAQFFENIFY